MVEIEITQFTNVPSIAKHYPAKIKSIAKRAINKPILAPAVEAERWSIPENQHRHGKRLAQQKAKYGTLRAQFGIKSDSGRSFYKTLRAASGELFRFKVGRGKAYWMNFLLGTSLRRTKRGASRGAIEGKTDWLGRIFSRVVPKIEPAMRAASNRAWELAARQAKKEQVK